MSTLTPGARGRVYPGLLAGGSTLTAVCALCCRFDVEIVVCLTGTTCSTLYSACVRVSCACISSRPAGGWKHGTCSSRTVLKVQKYYDKADALFDIEEVTEYCEDIDILMKQHKEVNEYDDVVLMEFHIRNDDGFDVSVYFHILRPLSMILGFTFY